MKHFITSLIAAILMAMASVHTARAEGYTLMELRAGVTEANEECPVDSGDGLYLIMIELDDNTMTLDYYFYTDGEVLTIDLIREDQKEFEGLMYESLVKTDDPGQKAMIDALKKYGYGITITFIDDDEETESFVFLNEEI